MTLHTLLPERPTQTSYHRQVVTSFICRLDGSSFKDFKVLILKRSDKTRDHQNLWAACSGTVQASDPEPLTTAWRHVLKETSLNPDDLSLLHEGKPHSVFAEDLSKRWTIHPFAFVLKSSARNIKTDWKHTECQFVHPEEVETYDTVPDLDITLWRTLVGPDTAEGLRQLREDHKSGARSLATKAVRILLMSVTGSDLDWSSNLKSYWRAFRLVAWHLSMNGRPSMGAAIGRAVLKAVVVASSGIVDGHCTTVGQAKDVIISACMQTLAERASGRCKVAQQFVDYLASSAIPRAEITFLTLSISCAKLCVLEYVRQMPTQAVHIIVLESRPCFEGVQMAADLDKQLNIILSDTGVEDRVRITLATDASVGYVAQDVDYIVLGSDRISPVGDVSNKVGSLSAILTAQAVSKKTVEVLITSETEKIAHRGISRQTLVEMNDSQEVADAWPQSTKSALLGSPRVTIINVFFEWVPSKYISRYITEEGVMKREDIGFKSDVAAKEWEDVFQDL